MIRTLPVLAVALALPLAGAQDPKPKAALVHVKGTVAVTVGKTEKTVEMKDVSLKAGADVGFGTFVLRENAAVFDQKAPRSFSLTYRGSKVVKAVAFTDPNGADVPVRP